MRVIIQCTYIVKKVMIIYLYSPDLDFHFISIFSV